MTDFTASDAAVALQNLNEQTIGRQNAFIQYNDATSDESEDDEGQEHPIIGAFIERGTEEAILKMTNHTLQEFEHIYGQLRDHIAVRFNTGRGKKCYHTPMDMFFLVLVVCKAG